MNLRGLHITPHAIARYRDRVDPEATHSGAVAALRSAAARARRLHTQGSDKAIYSVDGRSWRIVVRNPNSLAPALLTVLPSDEIDPDEPTGELYGPLPLPSEADQRAAREARVAAARAAEREEQQRAATERQRVAIEAMRAELQAKYEQRLVAAAQKLAAVDQVRAELQAGYERKLSTAREQAENARNGTLRRARRLLHAAVAHVPADLRTQIHREISAAGESAADEGDW